MGRVSPRVAIDRKGSQLLASAVDFLVRSVAEAGHQQQTGGKQVRTQAFKVAIASATVGALTLLTAGTALASPGGEAGPEAPVANMGLGIAVNNVIANAANQGANVAPDPGLGTHLAVGIIMVSNPAVDVCAEPFSLCD